MTRQVKNLIYSNELSRSAIVTDKEETKCMCVCIIQPPSTQQKEQHNVHWNDAKTTTTTTHITKLVKAEL